MSYVPGLNAFGMLASIGDDIAADRERQKQEDLDNAQREEARAKGFPVPVRPQPEGFLHRLTRTITGEPEAPAVPVSPIAQPVPNAAPASVNSQYGVPDTLWRSQIGQESGGKQFGPGGQPLTSSAGAIGVAQVMPGTAPEAARLAGVQFDPQRYRSDPAYNELLGRAYMGEQMKHFGGDPAKALAAYNAGPGAVEKAVARHGGDWLAFMPAETQDYVARITKRAGPVQVAGPLPASTGAKMADGYTAPAQPTETPEAMKGWPKALQTLPGIMAAMQNPYMKNVATKALEAYTKAADKEEGKYTTLTTPEQRAQHGIREDDQNIYQIDGKNRLVTVGSRGSTQPHVVGGALVDNTGKVIYHAPEKASTFEQRSLDADRLRLEGDERKFFLANGKLPVASEKAPTGEQANAATFATRMSEAEKIVSDPRIFSSALGTKGAVSDFEYNYLPYGNSLVSPEYQQYQQAKEDFINASLRRESGAAISKDEFKRAERQYFPQVGDSEAVIKQKAHNRDTQMRSIAKAAVPAFAKQFEEKNPEAKVSKRFIYDANGNLKSE